MVNLTCQVPLRHGWRSQADINVTFSFEGRFGVDTVSNAQELEEEAAGEKRSTYFR